MWSLRQAPRKEGGEREPFRSDIERIARQKVYRSARSVGSFSVDLVYFVMAADLKEKKLDPLHHHLRCDDGKEDSGDFLQTANEFFPQHAVEKG